MSDITLIDLAVAFFQGMWDASPLLVIAGLVCLYFAPALQARSRKHPQCAAITTLNVLAGWTFVGWVVAMVWSASAIRKN